MAVAHRRLEKAKREACRFRIHRNDAPGSVLAPIHGLHIDRRLAVELLHAFPGQSLDLLGRHRRLETQSLGGAVDALAMEVEIRRDAVEPAGTVEYGRTEPHRMGCRADQRRVAGKPLAVDKGPGGGSWGCIDGHRCLLLFFTHFRSIRKKQHEGEWVHQKMSWRPFCRPPERRVRMMKTPKGRDRR